MLRDFIDLIVLQDAQSGFISQSVVCRSKILGSLPSCFRMMLRKVSSCFVALTSKHSVNGAKIPFSKVLKTTILQKCLSDHAQIAKKKIADIKEGFSVT